MIERLGELADGGNLEELFDELDAPVERVCGLNICSPFSPVLEDKNFPHPEDIVAAVKRVLNK